MRGLLLLAPVTFSVWEEPLFALISTYLLRIVLGKCAVRSELNTNNVQNTHLSPNQKKVLSAVRTLREENEGPVRTSQVRERTGKGSSHTSDLLGDLVELGELVKLKRGIYDLPEFVEPEFAERGESERDQRKGQPKKTQGRKEQSSERCLEEERNNQNNRNGRPCVTEWPLEQGEAPLSSTGASSTLQVDDRLIRSYIGYVPDRSEAFFCRIEGDSMQPWLSEGEYVFAMRTDRVGASGRHVVWWGEQKAQMCVQLTLVGQHPESKRHPRGGQHPEVGEAPDSSAEEGSTEESSAGEDRGQVIRLKRYGPEETMILSPVSDGIYETEQGNQIRMQIRGRVVWPSSTAQDTMETVTDQMGKVLGKAMGS